MRFITEFSQDSTTFDASPEVIRLRKEHGQDKLGCLIAESFGWQNPANGNTLHHTIEIEAFPMDKWVEFKMALFTELQAHNVDQIKILQLIKELESFGKPSGDAITNQKEG